MNEWGYGLIMTRHPILMIINIWLILTSIIAISILFITLKKTNDIITKKQIKNIIVGILIVIIFSISTNIIPQFLNIEVIPLATVSFSIFSLFIAASIQKYGLFIYLPMSESVLDTNKLLSLNRDELEKEVTARTKALLKSNEELKRSLDEKEVLLKEIHHRVKNNLSVVSGLLKLQSDSIDDEDVFEKFKESMNRVKSMALIHDKVYCLGNISQIDFEDYLSNLLGTLFHSYHVSGNKISLSVSAVDVFLDLDTAISCGLIVNELVSNSLKHGFPDDQSGEISIEMTSERNEYTLVVKDTGVGFSGDVDCEHPDSLGLQLVHMLVKQLEGSIYFESNQGLNVIISFRVDNDTLEVD